MNQKIKKENNQKVLSWADKWWNIKIGSILSKLFGPGLKNEFLYWSFFYRERFVNLKDGSTSDMWTQKTEFNNELSEVWKTKDIIKSLNDLQMFTKQFCFQELNHLCVKFI